MRGLAQAQSTSRKLAGRRRPPIDPAAARSRLSVAASRPHGEQRGVGDQPRLPESRLSTARGGELSVTASDATLSPSRNGTLRVRS